MKKKKSTTPTKASEAEHHHSDADSFCISCSVNRRLDDYWEMAGPLMEMMFGARQYHFSKFVSALPTDESLYDQVNVLLDVDSSDEFPSERPEQLLAVIWDEIVRDDDAECDPHSIRMSRFVFMASLLSIDRAVYDMQNGDYSDCFNELCKGYSLFGRVMGRIESAMGKDSRTWMAQLGGRRKNEKSNIAKAFVQAEWAAHRAAYDGNKSAFARDYVRRVANEYSVTITEKQMREVWLKDTPSAGRPDGVQADG